MFHRIHQKLGTAGFVISIVALVMALGGAAYAASGGLSGKQKKEVEKIAKKYAGAPGAAGATGPAGANGKAGADGSNGTNGAAGESVTISTASAGECPSGGTKFSNKTASGHVCNGTTGFTETLPSGKTETGAWSAEDWTEGTAVVSAISFPIPLELGLNNKHVVYLNYEEAVEQEASERTTEIEVSAGVKMTVGEICPGFAETPEAAKGFLCIYTGELGEMLHHTVVIAPIGAEIPGTAKSGAVLAFEMEAEASVPEMAWGTWAVTAP